MAVNVSVVKNGTENSMSLIRRFQKRVQGAGIVRRVKGNRYRARLQSKNRRKNSALVRVARRAEVKEKEKLGLIQERPVRGRRR